MEKVTIEELLQKIETVPAKEALIEMGIINNHYVPFLDKVSILNLALEKAIRRDANGVVYISNVIHRLNVYGALIILYTNLECYINNNGDYDFIITYDMLSKHNILNEIINLIDRQEYEEIIAINKSLLEEFNETHNNIKYIAINMAVEAANKFGSIINNKLDQIVSIIRDDERMNNIVQNVKGTLRRFK